MNKLSPSRYLELESLVLEKDILDLQESLNQRLFTISELVVFYLSRIMKYNMQVHAVIELNPDAIELAAQMDKELFEGRRRSLLHGIPFLIKDNIGTKDQMHNTAGAKFLEDARVIDESDTIQKIRRCGGIILGKTNLSEWAFYMSSKGINGYSALGGQTINPYGTFDVGGSSSGSAVSVALNLASVALGSETYGSIICPANQNSVVGYKPTWNAWDSRCTIPIAPSLDTIGPITKSVKDARILHHFLSVKGKDCQKVMLEETQYELNFPIKVGVLVNRSLEAEYRDDDALILHEALEEMKKNGFIIESIYINDKVFEIEKNEVLEYEFKHSIQEYFANCMGTPHITLKDVINFNHENLNERAPYGQDLLEEAYFSSITKESWFKMLSRDQKKCQEAIDEQLKTYDVLVTLSNYFSSIYAYAGYPAINVPTGYRKTGEPVGITFVASAHEDEKLLGIAEYYENISHAKRKPPQA
ncbi:MAG: hypothetical protein JXQ26_05675 [Tissierellales bacterium]|nr:hypothetical protein [Tissierellales bacterium]